MTTTATNKERGPWPAQWLIAIVDYAVSSHARAVAVLAVTALLAFLPGFFQIPPADRDEARFAQATKQMLESGDFIDIRFQDEVRYKKPVGIYWLQAGAVKAADMLGVADAHTTIWLYRIPSLIGATGAVLLTYWTALAFVSRRAALLAGLMMATSILLGRRGAARQDRRRAADDRGGRDGRDGAGLSRRTPAGGARRRRLDHAGDLLDRAGRRHPVEGAADRDGGRADRGDIGAVDRSVRWLAALRPLPGRSGSASWCCPGSSPS